MPEEQNQNPKFDRKPDPRLRKPGLRRTQPQENSVAPSSKKRSLLWLPVSSIVGSTTLAALSGLFQ